MLPCLYEPFLSQCLFSVVVPAKEATPSRLGIPVSRVEADNLIRKGTIGIDVPLQASLDDLSKLALSKMHGILGRSKQ